MPIFLQVDRILASPTINQNLTVRNLKDSMRSIVAFGITILMLFAGCTTSQPPPAQPLYVAEGTAGFSLVTDSLAPDPAVEALVEPYRQRLEEAITEVIGEAAIQLQKGGLESTLGNMASDAMLMVVNEVASKPVQMSLTNNGGLRVPIAPGPITVGKIFEVMPFENMMVVLEFSGAQIDTLAQQIASVGGEPIAGFSFRVNEETGTAHEIKVDGEALDPSATYRLVTSDYLANGGGRLPALWNAMGREDLNVLLRDSFIQYVRQTGRIAPEIEGRIAAME